VLLASNDRASAMSDMGGDGLPPQVAVDASPTTPTKIAPSATPPQGADAAEAGTEQVAAADSNRKRPDLTSGEIALARTIFGDRINYDIPKVFHKKWPVSFGSQPDDRVTAPDGSIYFPPTHPDYRDDFSTGASIEQQAEFLHEMMHVFQDQQGISVGPAHLVNGDYSYDLSDGKPFDKLGVEQQAQIVEDYFRLKHGLGPVSSNQKSFPLSAYERVLDIGPDGTMRARVKVPIPDPIDRNR
jgi:hypothetical protein